MPQKSYNQLVSEVMTLSYSEQLNLLALIVKQLQQENEQPIDDERYNANYVSSSSDPFYSKENMERLRASIMEMETTGGTLHEVTGNV